MPFKKFSSNFTPFLGLKLGLLLPDFCMAEFCKINLFSGVLSLSRLSHLTSLNTLYTYTDIPLVSHTSAHPYTLTCPHVHMARIHPHVSSYFSPPTNIHTHIPTSTDPHIYAHSPTTPYTPHIYFPQRTYPDTCIPLYSISIPPTSTQIFHLPCVRTHRGSPHQCWQYLHLCPYTPHMPTSCFPLPP